MPKFTQWHKTWLILATYAALAIGLTSPTFWRVNQAAYGQAGRDVLHYVWQLWWAKEALLKLQQLPSHVTVMGWPEGIYHPLLFVTPYIDMLGLPITLNWGATTTFNFHVLLSFTLSGFTAYLLSYAITKNRLAGFVGGVIFAFTAHRWAHAFTGHLYHITIYWGPLFTWAMWKFVQHPTKKRGLWVGLTAGFVSLTHVMHAAYWLLPVGLVLMEWGRRNFGRQNRAWWTKLLKGGLWGLIPLAIMVGPFYLYFFTTLNSTDGELEAGGIVGNASDLLAFITPTPTNPIFNFFNPIPQAVWQWLPPVDWDENVVYIGLAALLLAGLGLLTKRKKETRPWLWLAIITGFLAMGPFLKIGGSLVTFDINETSSHILLPYALLAKIPPLSWGRTTGRLSQTMMIGVSVLAAFGVVYLRKHFKSGRLLAGVVLGLSTIFILESLVVFPFTPATPVNISPYYRQLAANPTVTQGGMLDLPLRNKLEVNRAMFTQTFHRRPIVGGYIHRRFLKVEWGEHFADLLFRPATNVPAFTSPTNANRLAALNALGISTVVLHKDMVDHPTDQIQAEFIDSLLGPASYDDDLVSVYHVPKTEPLQQPIVFARASNWTGDGRFPESNSPRHVYMYTPHDTNINWSLSVAPTNGPTVLSIDGSNMPRQKMLITGPQDVQTWTVPAPAGIYRFNFVNNDICQSKSNCAPILFNQVTLTSLPQLEEPLSIWENNNIQLLKYTLAPEANGQPALVLTWLPQTSPGFEPTLFIHVLDAQGKKIAQVDRQLFNGQYPTSAWKPGLMVPETISLPIPINKLNSAYTLKLGLYNVADGNRLPLSQPQTDDQSLELLLDKAIWLSTLTEQ